MVLQRPWWPRNEARASVASPRAVEGPPRPAPLRGAPTRKWYPAPNGAHSPPLTNKRLSPRPTRPAALEPSGRSSAGKVYSSHLTHWRQERAIAITQALAPRKRGPKPVVDPSFKRVQQFLLENERLTERLRKAEIIIDVQKKIASLLGLCPAPGALRQTARLLSSASTRLVDQQATSGYTERYSVNSRPNCLKVVDTLP